jgi:hypothetical protein
MTCGVVVVELRGFEPLTPCMPSRDLALKRCWSHRLRWSLPKLGETAVDR